MEPNCPAPHVWDEVKKADGSTWLVMRCDVCCSIWSCDPKAVVRVLGDDAGEYEWH